MNTSQPTFRSKRVIFLTALLMVSILFVIGLAFSQILPTRADSSSGGLKVEIVAGYNLVVDSNVQSPSTYGPSVATVIGKFCNTLTDTRHASVCPLQTRRARRGR